MILSKPIKYTDEIDPAWSITAVDTFKVTPRPDFDDPVALTLDGRCPRCNDPMEHTEFLIAFRGVGPTSPDALRAAVKPLWEAGELNKPALPAEFSVRCCCQVKHPDRLGRSGLTGCGAAWKMRIESIDESTQ